MRNIGSDKPSSCKLYESLVFVLFNKHSWGMFGFPFYKTNWMQCIMKCIFNSAKNISLHFQKMITYYLDFLCFYNTFQPVKTNKTLQRKKQNKSDLSWEISNAFVLFIIGPIYRKQSFEVKINCIKTTSIYKLIYNYMMLLTSKCKIKNSERKQYTLGVGGTEIKTEARFTSS